MVLRHQYHALVNLLSDCDSSVTEENLIKLKTFVQTGKLSIIMIFLVRGAGDVSRREVTLPCPATWDDVDAKKLMLDKTMKPVCPVRYGGCTLLALCESARARFRTIYDSFFAEGFCDQKIVLMNEAVSEVRVFNPRTGARSMDINNAHVMNEMMKVRGRMNEIKLVQTHFRDPSIDYRNCAFSVEYNYVWVRRKTIFTLLRLTDDIAIHVRRFDFNNAFLKVSCCYEVSTVLFDRHYLLLISKNSEYTQIITVDVNTGFAVDKYLLNIRTDLEKVVSRPIGAIDFQIIPPSAAEIADSERFLSKILCMLPTVLVAICVEFCLF